MIPRISAVQGLAALPEDLPWAEFSWGVVESPAAIDFLDLTDPERVRAARQYPKGLAFGLHSELRWLRRASGLLHLVYVSDQGRNLPGATAVADLTAVPPAEASDLPDGVLLWGTKDAQAAFFFEGRIPRLLHYPATVGPVESGARLAVAVKHYILTETVPAFTEDGIDFASPHNVALFRCVRLVPGGAL